MKDCEFMEKLGHTFVHDCEAKPSPEKEKCPDYDRVSAGNCTNRDDINNMGVQSSGILTSRNSAEKDYGSRSFSNENASSTVEFDGSSKEGDISKLSDGVESKEETHANTDLSSDTGPQLNMESGVNVTTVNGKHLNSGDFFKSVIYRRKLVTESSCSNSTLVTLPLSSSIDSYQEISTEAKPSEQHTSGSSTSFHTDFGCSIEEPVTSHEVSIMGAQITQEDVYNVRAMDNLKVPETTRNQTPSVIQEENSSISCLQKQRTAVGPRQGKEEHSKKVGPQSSSFGNESNLHAISDTSVHLLSSRKLSCLTETKEEVQSSNANDKSDSVCSRHIASHEISIKNAHSAAERRPVDLDPALIYQLDGKPHGKEYSESVMIFADNVAFRARTSHTDRFDLNEVAHSDDFDCRKQIVCETGSSCHVIRVVAKSGVRLCYPVTPLKFEGAKGWKGSSATSAFHPILSKSSDRKASVFKYDDSSKHSKGSIEIDLNVAAEEDNAEHVMHGGFQTSSPHSFTRKNRTSVPVHQRRDGMGEVNTRRLFKDDSLILNSSRAERPSIDLNCLDTAMCPRTSPPVMSTRTPMVDLNLNEDPSTETSSRGHQQWRKNQNMDKMSLVPSAISFPENSRDGDFSFATPVYWTDLSPIQFFGHTQTRPLLVAAPGVLRPVEQIQKVVPLQPRLPYSMHTLPSHSYPSGCPFFIGPGACPSSCIQYPGPVPYARDPRVPVFPQIMNQSMLPSFPGTPHLMQVVHVENPYETTAGVMNGENLPVYGNLRDDTCRQFLSPAKSSAVEDHVKPFHLAPMGANQPLKRREPDGGWTSYQLGNRSHLKLWN